jgi:MFS family permease
VQLPRSFAPLRHRRFAALWTGAFLSNIGTWMETIGVGILVQEETGQALWSSLVIVAGFAPNALLAPLGGALADRFPRRAIFLTTTTVQAALAGMLTVLAATGNAHPASVTAIVLASGCALAFGIPAYQAMMPDLVPREDIPAAMGLGIAQYNLGRVIGPALAGLVIAGGGYEWAFGLNTVSFLAVFVAVAPLRLPAPIGAAGETIRRAIRSGARFVRSDGGLRALVVYLGLNSLLAAPFIALVSATADEVFHDEKAGTSALVTAQGIGAVVMAIALGGLTHRYGHRRVLLVNLGALYTLLAAYALAPTLELAVVAIFFVGATYLGCLSGFLTIAQLRTPPELRGRVMSITMMLIGATYPLGSVIQGAVADVIGLRATIAGAAAILAASVVLIRLVHPGFDRELDAPEAPAGAEDVATPAAPPSPTPAP